MHLGIEKLLKRVFEKAKLNKNRRKVQRITGVPETDEPVVLQEVFESVEEMERRNVGKPKKALKGSKGELKKKAPEKLRAKRRRRISKKRQMRQLISMMALFLFTAFVAVFLMHEHYVKYPGILERDTIRLMGRGKDYIALRWDEPRNTEEYEIYYKEYIRTENTGHDSEDEEFEPDETWEKKTTTAGEFQVSDLKESSYYAFVLRACNEYMDGKYTKPRIFSTKRTQNLKVDKHITKLTVNEPFKIDANASTELEFVSSDKEVADIDPRTGNIVLKEAGVTEITVKAKEDNQFTAATEVVQLEVIDSAVVPAGGASAFNIYHLSPDNCEVVKTVTGAGGAVIPQGLGYDGDNYYVVFGMGSPNRIVRYEVDGEGSDVSTPRVDLGKPNGFAYADENKTAYCVKGWSSRAVTYEPETGAYSAVSLPYGCSGIGYDRKEKLLMSSSRTVMAAYDISNGYSVEYTTGVVRHSGKTYTQDIGAHGGIMLRCLSGGSKHGTNYIDLYDMKHGNYLGTITCDLSEVESAIVNKDGYLEILSNNSGSPDYIWRTNINIDSISEGLPAE